MRVETTTIISRCEVIHDLSKKSPRVEIIMVSDMAKWLF